MSNEHKRLKQLRKNAGLTQQALADLIPTTKDTLAKWEQGRNRIPSDSLLCLSRILGVSVDTLLGGNDMLNNLDVIDDNYPEPMIIHGKDQVLKVLAVKEAKEEEQIQESYRLHEMGITPNYSVEADKETYLLLYDTEEDDLTLVWDFGKYIPEAHEYIFQTKYIPMITSCLYMSDDYSITREFLGEISRIEDFKARNQGKKVLILLHTYGGNLYKVWSYDEKKVKYIREFKTYRDNFEAMNEIDGSAMVNGSEEYAVYIPTKQFISNTGLFLAENQWSLRCPGDEWEARPSNELRDDIITDLDNGMYNTNAGDLYKQAINEINRSYSNDLGHDHDYFLLETRTKRLERLVELEAPKEVVCKELNMVKAALDSINN